MQNNVSVTSSGFVLFRTRTEYEWSNSTWVHYEAIGGGGIVIISCGYDLAPLDSLTITNFHLGPDNFLFTHRRIDFAIIHANAVSKTASTAM